MPKSVLVYSVVFIHQDLFTINKINDLIQITLNFECFDNFVDEQFVMNLCLKSYFWYCNLQ